MKLKSEAHWEVELAHDAEQPWRTIGPYNSKATAIARATEYVQVNKPNGWKATVVKVLVVRIPIETFTTIGDISH